jgi:hypothetical protein
VALDPANAANGIGVFDNADLGFFGGALNSGTPSISRTITANQSLTATGCGWLTLIGSVAYTPGDALWDPYLGSSTTSMTIGTGTFNPNIGANQNVAVGDYLQLYASSTQWMIGNVTAYNSTAGASTISVGSYSYGGHYGAATGGSGTFSSWTISKVRIWLTTGAGLIRIDIPQASGALPWVEETSGIENMVGYNVTWALSGNVVATFEDMQLFCITSQPVGATGQNGRGPVAVTGSTIEGTLADVSASAGDGERLDLLGSFAAGDVRGVRHALPRRKHVRRHGRHDSERQHDKLGRVGLRAPGQGLHGMLD